MTMTSIQALTTPNSLTGALLVHGVGNPQIGEIAAAAKDQLRRIGLHRDLIREVNWNAVVEHPGEEGKVVPTKPKKSRELVVGTKYMAHLSRAIINTGQIALYSPNSSSRRRPLTTKSIDAIGVLLAGVPAAIVLAGFLLLTASPLENISTHTIARITALALVLVPLIASSLMLSLSVTTFDTAIVCGTFRKVLIGVGWPFAYPLFAIANVPVRWVAPPLVLILTTAYYAAFPHPNYWMNVSKGKVPFEVPTDAFFSSTFFDLLISGVIGLLLTYVLYWAVRRILFPIIKVTADVALYLGNPEYRMSVIQEVEEGVEWLIGKGCTQIIFITHSLGTIITVDTLRKSRNLRLVSTDVKLTLFTSGSPLRRFMARFFASQYELPVNLHRSLSERYPRFGWLNVFRPHDPIGGSLGLTSEMECCTDQGLPFWLAHVNYWADRVAYDRALEAYGRLEERGYPSDAKVKSDSSDRACDAVGFKVHETQNIRTAISGFLNIAFLAFAAYIAFSWTLLPLLTAPHRLQALTSGKATTTRGKVYLSYRERPVDGARTTISENMKTEFSIQSPKDNQRIYYNRLVDGSLNDKALIRERFSNGTVTVASDGGSAFIDVELRYLLAEPETYSVVGFERRHIHPWLYLAGSGTLLLWLPILVIVAALVMVYIITPLIMPMLGRATAPEWLRFPERIGRWMYAVSKGKHGGILVPVGFVCAYLAIALSKLYFYEI